MRRPSIAVSSIAWVYTFDSIEPTITTVNYGCPGESTVTFIQGGCPWTAQGFPLHDSFAGTQLVAASTFLQAHPEAAPSVEIIVLGPYDPFLGNLDFADPPFMALNDALAETVAGASARYANIFPTFNPQGDVDAETATRWMLTLWCANGDGHPSDLSYQVMADTIFEVSGY